MSTRSSAETISQTPIEDAARLKALMQDVSQSQAAFAEANGIGSQAQLWQFLNPQNAKGRPLNLQAALGFAHGLGCKVGDFSPSLQRFIDRIATFSTHQRNYRAADSKLPQSATTHQFINKTTKLAAEIMDGLDEDYRLLILAYAEFIEQKACKSSPNSQERASQ